MVRRSVLAIRLPSSTRSIKELSKASHWAPTISSRSGHWANWWSCNLFITHLVEENMLKTWRIESQCLENWWQKWWKSWTCWAQTPWGNRFWSKVSVPHRSGTNSGASWPRPIDRCTPGRQDIFQRDTHGPAQMAVFIIERLQATMVLSKDFHVVPWGSWQLYLHPVLGIFELNNPIHHAQI